MPSGSCFLHFFPVYRYLWGERSVRSDWLFPPAVEASQVTEFWHLYTSLLHSSKTRHRVFPSPQTISLCSTSVKISSQPPSDFYNHRLVLSQSGFPVREVIPHASFVPGFCHPVWCFWYSSRLLCGISSSFLFITEYCSIRYICCNLCIHFPVQGHLGLLGCF